MYGVDVSPALVSKVTDGILKGAHRLGRTGRLTGVIPCCTYEIEELTTDINHLCAQVNPALLAASGVGADTAAALLVAAGDNPERMRTEASFAALCGEKSRPGVVGTDHTPPA